MKKYPKEIYDKCYDFYVNLGMSLELISRLGNEYPAPCTISRKLKKMGVLIVTHPHKYIFNENLVIKLYKSGVSIKKIVEIIKGSCQETISNFLKSKGFLISKSYTVPQFDNTIFDVIDTEEKAYWLGFIYADGCIVYVDPNKSKKNYAFELSLLLKDIQHLNKFNKFMKFNKNNVVIKKAPISKIVKQCQKKCVFQVSNKHLWETLNSYGCTPRKSLTVEFPNKKIFKDESLIRHFIRGYFDGDGWVGISNKKYLYPGAGFCGTELFIQEALKYIPITTNAKIRNKDKLYFFYTANQLAKKMLDYLYKDSTIYLNRKYKKYKAFCPS